MCMLLYIASDHPLPEIPWDEKNPAFYVTSKLWEKAECIRNIFTKPYVYYLGSHQKCGCGFSYDNGEEDKRRYEKYPETLAKAIADNNYGRENMRRLREYQEAAIELGDVELYGPQGGSEDTEPKCRLHIGPDYFLGEEAGVPTGQFFIVSKDYTSLEI